MWKAGISPTAMIIKDGFLPFFESESDMDIYISDLYSDIELSAEDPYFTDMNNGYMRQIEFLKNLRGNKNI